MFRACIGRPRKLLGSFVLLVLACFVLFELNTRFDGIGRLQESYPQASIFPSPQLRYPAPATGLPTEYATEPTVEEEDEEREEEATTHSGPFTGEDRAVQSRRRCRVVYGEPPPDALLQTNFTEGAWPVSNLLYPFENRIFLAKDYSLMYCSIAKAFSSNWKRIFLAITSHHKTATDIEANPDLLSKIKYPHELLWFKDSKALLRDLDEQEIKSAMEEYYKFAIVRDPVLKAISAYRDKFYSTTDDYYHKYIRKYIGNGICRDIESLRTRQDTPSYLKTAQIDCGNKYFDLQAFLSWVFLVPDSWKHASPRMIYNPHWSMSVPICRLCQPNMKYSFIGHFENGMEDIDFIFKQAGFYFEFPHVSDTTMSAAEDEAFRKDVAALPKPLVNELYQKAWTERYILGYTDQIPKEGGQYFMP